VAVAVAPDLEFANGTRLRITRSVDTTTVSSAVAALVRASGGDDCVSGHAGCG